ncbi:hypothetical protein P9112_009189 [Eukaryota sp. TZLM1-RC]
MHLLLLLFLLALSVTCRPAFIEDKSLGLESEHGSLLAFGDFDNDRRTDIFVRTQNTIKVLRFDSDKNQYVSMPKSSQTIDSSADYLSIIPTDFNRDGHLDFLTLTRDNDVTSSYTAKLYLQVASDNSPVPADEQYSLPPLLTQPLVVPYGEDMYPSLLARTADGPKFFENQGQTKGFVSRDLDDVIIDLPDQKLLDLPHVITDLNGDCRADLVLFFEGVCEEDGDEKCVEALIFIADKKMKFKRDQSIILPKFAGVPLVLDMNRDGLPDFVIPIRDTENSKNQLKILYNSQMPLCANLPLDINRNRDCRQGNNLCVVDNKFKIGKDRLDSELDEYHSILIDLPDSLAPLLTVDNPDGSLLNGGDFDSDGFFDLSIKFVDDNGDEFFNVLRNSPCDSEFAFSNCTTDYVSSTYQRSFGYFQKFDMAPLTTIKNPSNAVFFDFGNQGSLDLIVQSKIDGETRLTSLVNNVDNSAFFISVSAGNGVCHQWCPSPMPRLPYPKPFGVSAVGNTFRFRLLDFDNTVIVHGDSPFNQQSHGTLQTPYTYFGLGYIASYVDELFMGVSNSVEDKRKYINSWMTLLPNSSLFVFPYPSTEPSHWQLLLYAEPSDNVLYVGYGVVALLCLLGAMIGFFKMKEMKEDQLEKEKMGQQGLLI